MASRKSARGGSASGGKKQRKTLDEYFYFKNTDEFIIFLIWGLFTSAFLLNFLK